MIAKTETGDIIVWCLVLVAVVGILGAGVWFLRRRLFAPITADTGEEWSLQQLRELRRDGKITETEFESLRAGMIAHFQAGNSSRAESAETEAPRAMD